MATSNGVDTCAHPTLSSLMTAVIDLPNAQASEELAARLAACLVSPLVLTFSGEIGAGKTTLIRAMLRCLGVSCAIKSPTFSLVETYQTQHLIHHVDLYRVHDESELDYMGYRDLFSNDAVCCIEWPERVSSGVENADVAFFLYVNGVGRKLHAHAYSVAGSCFLSNANLSQ